MNFLKYCINKFEYSHLRNKLAKKNAFYAEDFSYDLYFEPDSVPYKIRRMLLNLEKCPNYFVKKKLYDEIIDFVMSFVDMQKYNSLLEQFSDVKILKGGPKFLYNNEFYIRKNIDLIILLNLHNRRNINILDIGVGFGWFNFICTLLGHSVSGIEKEDADKIYETSRDLLNIKSKIHTIYPFNPLPKFEDKIDLVVCAMVCFNLYPQFYEWGVGEWSYFINDLKNNICNDNFELFIEFNFHVACRRFKKEERYTDLMKQWMVDNKFIFNKRYAYYTPQTKLPFEEWFNQREKALLKNASII